MALRSPVTSAYEGPKRRDWQSPAARNLFPDATDKQHADLQAGLRASLENHSGKSVENGLGMVYGGGGGYLRRGFNRSSTCRVMNAATDFKPETANAVFWPSMYARSTAISTTITTAAQNQRIA
jgi:hypothetical protein